jgi:hypothetical protein
MSLEKSIKDNKLYKLYNKTSETIGTNNIKYSFDDPISRGISFIGNLPNKLWFFSKDIGNYPRQKTQDYISEYVKESGLENTTIRVGHSAVFEDLKRIKEEESVKNMSAFSRFLYLTYTGAVTLVGGLISKLTRSDNYNPFTKTAVIYSDVPAIAIHELAHAKDYQSKKHPVLYNLSRLLHPFLFFQEGKASIDAHEYIKSKDKNEKTNRYLIPAFLSYVINFLFKS